MKNHLILGNWNVLCDSCGRKFKASQVKKRWDGLMVCEEDWEMRHPSDFLRVQKEKISVPFSRPYPAEDTYLNTYCTLAGITAYANIAVAGCSTANNNNWDWATQDDPYNLIQDLQTAIADIAIAEYMIAEKPYSYSPGT